MIVTKEQQEAMVDKYVKEKHTTDECIGFIDGINATLNLVNKLDNYIIETNYENENEQFVAWWNRITSKSDNWTTLERMAAHDSWMEARGVFK